MKKWSKGMMVAGAALATVVATGAWAAGNFNNVEPHEFDPAHSFLVQAAWLGGIGCPTNASYAAYPATNANATYTACPSGDTKDKHNEGLILDKTGPTNNNASATADLKDVKDTALTELGYDIRKPTSSTDPRGSHCGAGAPRFNVVTSDGVTHFIGCNSPPAVLAGSSNAWIRLRWGAAELLAAFPSILSGSIASSISIIFDEGTDTGPDNFGMAVLDNIDVNGTLAGKGPTGQ